MSAERLISIIVPIYNESNNVTKMIKQLQRLDGLHEAVLVDASDDPESRAIVANNMLVIGESSKIRFICSSKAGRAVQMNLGARSCNGDVLVFLHCDTRLPAAAFDLIQQEIDSGHDWGLFEVSLAAKGLVYRIIERMINFRSRIRRMGTGDQAIFITTALFQKCGGYPQIALMEDIAICKALNRFSPPGLIRRAVVTSARRWQTNGAAGTIFLMWKLRFLFWLGVDSERLASMYQDER